MNNNIDPSIIAKAQKLLNLKEGAEAVGSMHEAENAAARLQMLLMKHNLDIGMVQQATIEKKIAVESNYFNLAHIADKRESVWVPKLFSAIANNNLCKAWADDKGIRILGHTDTVQLVMYIGEQLIAKIRIAEKEAWRLYEREHKDDPYAEKRGTFRRGFLMGCANGIERRLREEKQNMQASDNPYAVMIVSREKELDEYLHGTQEERDARSKAWAEQRNKRKALLEQGKDKLAKLSDRTRLYIESRDNEELGELLQLEGNDFNEACKEAYKSRTRYRYSRSSGESRSGRISSNAGFSRGVEAGKKMNINKGVGGSQSKGQIN